MPSTRPGGPPVVPLPLSLDIALKPPAEHTPMEAFIAKHEPHFTYQSEPWRADLLAACVHYADDLWHARFLQTNRILARLEERREELGAGFDSRNSDPQEPSHG